MNLELNVGNNKTCTHTVGMIFNLSRGKLTHHRKKGKIHQPEEN